MDLPFIGSHCALSTCNDLDLLPIRCQCDLLFCRHHITPEAHHCSVDPVSLNPAAGVPVAKLQRCAAEKCTKPSLESFVASDETGRSPATCSSCYQAFCARSVHNRVCR